MMDAVTTGSMTAWTQSRYGGPEVVEATRIEVPSPAKGEVLLEVHAASINSGDVKIMRGEPLLIRPVFGLRRPRVATRGMDVAGTVVAVGDGVSQFAIGDEVMGELPGGTLAEYVAGPAARLAPRPAGLAPAIAAALPLAGGTAWQALEAGGVGEGDRVLVIGASGGVGHYAVQLAAARGAEVWALCGARSEQLVASIGAVRTFDYRSTDAAALPGGSFDVVIDIAGTAPLRTLRRLVRRSGTLVLVSGEGSRFGGPIGRILRSILLSPTPGPRVKPLAAVAKADVTRELASLAVAGRIRPAIEVTFALDRAGEALAHVDDGHTVGKVVVTIG